MVLETSIEKGSKESEQTYKRQNLRGILDHSREFANDTPRNSDDEKILNNQKGAKFRKEGCLYNSTGDGALQIR